MSYKIHFLPPSILGPSKQNPKFIPKPPKSSQLLIFSQPPPNPNKKENKKLGAPQPTHPVRSFNPGGFNLKSSGSNELISNQLGIDMPMFTVTRLMEVPRGTQQLRVAGVFFTMES